MNPDDPEVLDPEPPEPEADEDDAEPPPLDLAEAARVLLGQPEVKAAVIEAAREIREKAEGSTFGRWALQFGRDWLAGRQAREAREKEHDEG